jgi:hypothetical protein
MKIIRYAVATIFWLKFQALDKEERHTTMDDSTLFEVLQC